VSNSIVSAIAAMLLVGASTSQAALIVFDPDGAGPDPAVQVGTFDLLPGNSLNQNALPGPLTTIYFQSRLGSLTDGTGHAINVPGLNSAPLAGGSNFEITAVAKFGTIQSNVGNTTNLGIDPSRPGTLDLYYDTAANSNDKAGTGFTDGTHILSANINFVGSSFTVFPTLGLGNLDNFGPNDYPGVQSVRGAGGAEVDAAVSTFNPAFFVTSLAGASLNTSTSTALPFNEVDPSVSFQGTAANIGTINGVTGTDVIQQTDASIAFSPIPEPASAGLLMLGLVGALCRRRRA
jgi:hypothetical protein